MNHKTLLPLALITYILMSGCNSLNKTPATPGGSEMLYASQWYLAELNGKTVMSGKAHLLFSPGKVNKVSGNAGCNRLNGTFELTSVNFIKFSPLATTRMACEPGVRESEFTEALGEVNNWSIINNQLLLNNGKLLLARLNAVSAEASKLDGTWELNYISGPRIAFEGLYPDKKPQISFNLAANEVGGNTSCNGFSSKIMLEGNKISIAEPFAKTMMFCDGDGESTFLNMLEKVNRYAVTDGNTLNFMIDDVAVMRFTKK